MPIQEQGVVLSCTPLAPAVFDLVLQAPASAGCVKPGQFVHVLCGEGTLLRRPISVCDAQEDTVRLVFQTKGEGTSWLAKRKAGDRIDLLSDLGHGYDFAQMGKHPVCIGGGIGTPPLLFAMKRMKAQGVTPTAILGFRTQSAVILQQDFAQYGKTMLATEDGTVGNAGFVTDLLSKHGKEYTSIYACGPHGMLQRIAELAESYGLPCQVSLEERMGCGIGACLVCACKTHTDEGTKMQHVCKNGPVFDAKKVVWA